MKHKHRAIKTLGPWGFTAPVAVEPYTIPNPVAHGNVGYTEVCECGYERSRLENAGVAEYSPWRKSAAMLAAERQDQEQEQLHRRRLTRARALLASAHLSIIATARPPRRTVIVAPGVEMDLSEVEEAEDLLYDDTPVAIVVSGRRTLTTIGDLNQAANDWSDAPETPQYAMYSAISALLP